MKKMTLFVGVLFGLIFFGSTHAAVLSGSRPNIIFILADDLGKGDLACLGNPDIETPCIDKFYTKSLRLTDYHVSPSCSPSRAALMTGLHEFKMGVTHTIAPRYNMLLTEKTIADALKEVGYATGIFCKWHLGDKEVGDQEKFLPNKRGFEYTAMLTSKHGEHYFNPEFTINGKKIREEGYFTDVTFNLAMQWMEEKVKEKKPFFAYVADKNPHEPYVSMESEAQIYLKKGFSKDLAHRYGMIKKLDQNIGRIVEKIKDLGIEENTLIIFTSDNGQGGYGAVQTKNGAPWQPFVGNLRGGWIDFNSPPGGPLKVVNATTGGKLSPYEGGTRVPCFLRWKSHLEEGVDNPSLTAHLDMYATFCDLAGIPAANQKPTDGFSLMPIFNDPKKTIFQDRMLFIHSARWPIGANPDDYKYRNSAVRSSRFRLVNNQELYDIPSDPSEKRNVIDRFPEEANKMKEAYELWWSQVRSNMINDLPPK